MLGSTDPQEFIPVIFPHYLRVAIFKESKKSSKRELYKWIFKKEIAVRGQEFII